jgi:hypothetical protein
MSNVLELPVHEDVSSSSAFRAPFIRYAGVVRLVDCGVMDLASHRVGIGDYQLYEAYGVLLVIKWRMLES